jgi:hypothetical protein
MGAFPPTLVIGEGGKGVRPRLVWIRQKVVWQFEQKKLMRFFSPNFFYEPRIAINPF